PFILVTSFTVLNLFIAIIVNAMQSQHDADIAELRAEEMAAQKADSETILSEIQALRREVSALRRGAE
ncbi:MAG: ion transporter, partial [Tistlia sp.]